MVVPLAAASFHTHLLSLPATKLWAFQHLTISLDPSHLANAIRTSTCTAVSNGSLRTIGTAAFIFMDHTDTAFIQEHLLVPGPITPGNSYQCELVGLLAITYLLEELCSFYGISLGAAHICCNNTSALRVFEPWYIPHPTNNSFDITSSLWHTLRTLPIATTTEHVQGHQDKQSGDVPLSRNATTNVKMDAVANEYWSLLETSGLPTNPPIKHLAREQWSVWHNDVKLFSPTYETLYECLSPPLIRTYWTHPHTTTSPTAHRRLF